MELPLTAPLALACGHVVAGSAPRRWNFSDGTRSSTVECPDGCGWQTWVADPTLESRYEVADIDGRIVVSGTIGPVEVDDETYASFFGCDGSIDGDALERLLDLDDGDSP